MKQTSSWIMFTKTEAEQQLGTIKLFFYFISLVLYLLSTSSI